MQEKVCVRCYVAGKVQGVWFRAGTQDEAKRLGVTGWARNLPDGRVEVLACGEREKIEQLCAWLKKGPPLANVSEVIREDLPWQDFERFAVL
ncbi:MAG: acylphosphatase [Gammaproteobacteria bacterium]|nr:acylphosphatase [Gammaproteobacteria bacterium]